PKDFAEEMASWLVLRWFVETGRDVSVLLPTEWSLLEPVIDRLASHNYLIINGTAWEADPDGIQALEHYRQTQLEAIGRYDIFCAVDLATGEFAFAKYHQLNEQAFKRYLMQERFKDLRLAMVEYLHRQESPESIARHLYEVAFAVLWDRVEWFGKGWQDLAAVQNTAGPLEQAVQNTTSWKLYGDDEAHAESIFDDILRQGEDLMVKFTQLETT